MFAGDRSLQNAASSRSIGDSSMWIRFRSDTGSIWQIFQPDLFRSRLPAGPFVKKVRGT